MNTLLFSLLSAILIGMGATLTFDLWGIFLKHAFQITPSDICLVGRWIRTMPEGVFRHSNIRLAAQKRGECIVGWGAHYVIGITFAITFVALFGEKWLHQPSLLPALLFGVVTVLAPFLIMQPAFGLGVAASKTPNPMQARVRSLLNHTAYGFGLYFFGWVVNWVM